MKNSPSLSEWGTGDKIREFLTRADDNDSTLLLVVRDYVFCCNGNITEWYILWRHRDGVAGCIVTFHFYVLRSSGNAFIDNCNLMIVGQNALTVSIGENGDSKLQNVQSQLEVDPINRIVVQEGDITGVLVEFGSTCDCLRVYVGGRKKVQNTVYSQTFTSLDQAFPALSDTCTALQRNESIAPYITAAVGKRLNRKPKST